MRAETFGQRLGWVRLRRCTPAPSATLRGCTRSASRRPMPSRGQPELLRHDPRGTELTWTALLNRPQDCMTQIDSITGALPHIRMLMEAYVGEVQCRPDLFYQSGHAAQFAYLSGIVFYLDDRSGNRSRPHSPPGHDPRRTQATPTRLPESAERSFHVPPDSDSATKRRTRGKATLLIPFAG